jgi:hypothetical protein
VEFDDSHLTKIIFLKIVFIHSSKRKWFSTTNFIKFIINGLKLNHIVINELKNIYLSKKVKDKTKELIETNNSLKTLNNNLNDLVAKRTVKLSENIKKTNQNKR